MRLRENITLLCSVILLLLALTELVSYCILQLPAYQYIQGARASRGDVYQNLYPGVPDPELGWSLPRNETVRAKYTKRGDTPVYDVTYYFDSKGRRISPTKLLKSDAQRHVLLFGDSTVFGIGLDGDETLQHYLSEILPDSQIYNYAVFGYGPHQVLRILETKNLETEIGQKKGDAVYVFLSGHFYRAIESSANTWATSSPHYVLKDEKVVHLGAFEDSKSVWTRLLRVFSKIKEASNLLSLLQVQIPLSVSENNIELVAALIERSSVVYEEKFDGSFIVMIHPMFNTLPKETARLVASLRKRGVTVLDKSEIVINKSHRIPIDGHPSGEFNKAFAKEILHSINFSKDPK